MESKMLSQALKPPICQGLLWGSQCAQLEGPSLWGPTAWASWQLSASSNLDRNRTSNNHRAIKIIWINA